jgi:hypothetical protein
MDQFKEFLANVKKYHFWVLCGLVFIVGLVSWYLAKSSLDRETDTNVTQIKSKNEEIKTVKNFPDHPNEQFVAGMDRIIQPYSYEVGLGWKKRYDQQVKYLVWPQSLIEEAEGFLDQVKELRPIEKVPYPTPREKEIPTTYLTVYRNFITLELPKLAQTIGAKWYVATGSAGGDAPTGPPRSGGIYGAPGGAFSLDGGAGTAALEKDNSVVIWAEENQKQILETHFGFASRNQNPTTLEVLYAQEDLWVLQAIMQIIKKTNGNVDANYDAAVKAIDSLQIGRTARGRMGQITPILDKSATGGPEAMSMMPGGAPGMPTEGGAPPGMPGYGPGMGPPGAPGGSGATTPGAEADPVFERYVDVNYDPLAPESLRTAATSADPTVAIYAVAKRIPVRLRLYIDQRRLQDLLANCGNHEIPVEVRQVRINCAEGLSGGSGGAIRAGGGEYGGAPSGGGNSRRRPSGMGGVTNQSDENTQNVEVEVYGIVYIYNPPNEQLLGIQIGNTGDTTAENGTAPPTAAIPVTFPPRG